MMIMMMTMIDYKTMMMMKMIIRSINSTRLPGKSVTHRQYLNDDDDKINVKRDKFEVESTFNNRT